MADGIARRRFRVIGVILAAVFTAALAGPASAQDTPIDTPPEADDMHLPLTGKLKQVHDPVIIKEGDRYYLFHTGNGVTARWSPDMLEWDFAFPAGVFPRVPAWALDKIPGATNIWAPDISYFNDKYHLYYSVSTFGSNKSVIGLATNTTLDFESDEFEWVDQGLVVETTGAENYNAIDANLIVDADGVPWLSFGSFWSGIKMIRLDYDTGKQSAEDDTVYSLASRQVNSGSVEAPFIIRRGDYYYLFVSFDFCCRGAESTYNVRVGRSESITGPYVDRDDVEMMRGGGTQVTFPTDRWKGPGHNAIFQDEDINYIVYHAYDAELRGTPTLRIAPLMWDEECWPSIGQDE
jgi:arabinan endo-1,5-alpha-L-arabinosidase